MTPPGLLETTARRLEAAVGAFVSGHRLPGCAAGVVADGALAWSYGYGYADAASGRRPDEHTLYRIASISKTFTASAVLQLRDRGLLRLDDPLVRHVPEAASITNPFGPVDDITIRRLLLHTSGLQGEHPSDDLRVEQWGSIAMLVGQLPRVRVVIAPDTSSKYCNIGYQLLGAVVERVSGQPFMAYVGDHLLRPLGLSSTDFYADGDLRARRAIGYDARDRSDALTPAIELDSAEFEADGGLWSCVSDLAAWAGFQLSRRDAVLARATREEMWRKWVVGDRLETLQGLCWYWVPKGGDWFVGHGGSLNGFITQLLMSPDDDAAAVVLLNGVGDATALAADLLALAVEDVRSRPAGQLAHPPSRPDEHVEGLLGQYRSPYFAETSIVEWRDDALALIVDDRPIRLVPTGDPDRYRIDEGRGAGEALVFLRDPEGRVDAVNAAGYVSYAVRPVQ